jgi:hypothetical protein
MLTLLTALALAQGETTPTQKLIEMGLAGIVILALGVDRLRMEKRWREEVKAERDLNTKLTDALRDLSVKSTEVNVGLRDELRSIREELRE